MKSYFENIPLQQRLLFFIVAASGFLIDGYDLSNISFVLLYISKQFALTSLEYGLLSSASLAGMIPGALIFGYISDKMGRSKLMTIDLIFFTVFAILSAFSPNFLVMYISRFLLGVGIGGDYPLSSTLISEVAPSNTRGRYLTGAISLYWIGTAISQLVILGVLGTGPYFWKWVFIIGGIVAIPIILARIKLSESPRWLALKGKLKGEDVPKPEEESKGVNSFWDMFKGRLLILLLFTSTIWFLFDVAAYGIGLYYPLILHTLAFPSAYKTLYGTLAISASALAFYLVGTFIIDIIGRKPTLSIGLGVMGLILIIGGLISIKGISALIAFMLFAGIEQWAGAVTLFYPTELFPTSVRSSAQGFATSISRVGSVLGVTIFPEMVKALGFSISLEFFGSMAIIALVLSLVLGKETSRKPLEETSEGLK
ncbi:MAG: MFS transporter [Sulfolobaceae archaeon]|nr:MFS transporter [Sulfolobaceae archaeon]